MKKNLPYSPGNSNLFAKAYKKAFVIVFAFLISISGFANQVNSYTAACNAGPVYSVDANVSNVNSTSNYAWQYKNASNVWVCIVNGNNIINGNTYSVSGATSTATTNPSPIVFSTPAGLQGLIIRCVISNGTGVNPCNMPSGNTWNSNSSSVNHTINVTGTACGAGNTGSIGNRVWLDADADGIQDASETGGITGVTVELKNSAGTVIATTTTNASGNYSFTGLAAGNYKVDFPVSISGAALTAQNVGGNDDIDSDPSQANGETGTIALASGQNITKVDAGYVLLPDCACTTSASNLLVNGSFENGTTGWNWSNGTLTTGTDYVECGTKNGFNNWSSGTSRVWQDVTVAAGSSVTFSAYAGTHTAGLSCNPTLSLIFLNASNAVISQSNVTVTRDVGTSFGQLEKYTLTGVAPAGTTKVRVQSAINCNTMKLDAFCLTVTPQGIPDLTPNITAVPNIMHGTTVFNVSVRVTELWGNATNGSEILVRIPRDPRMTFTYSSSATSIGFTPVNNSVWTYDASDPIYHIFKTNAVIAANNFSTFGFVATFTPGQSQGKFTLTSSLNSGSGGETYFLNNQDAEVLDYFIN